MPKLVTRMTGLAASAALAPDDPAPSLFCEQPVRAPRARAAAPPESRDLREMVGVMCVPFIHDALRQKRMQRLCDRAERDNKMRRRVCMAVCPCAPPGFTEAATPRSESARRRQSALARKRAGAFTQ